MQQPIAWSEWALQTQQQLQQQLLRVADLERQVCELTTRLKVMEEKPSCTIEKLEYRFDQLKVERLDGTLHIGMSPQACESQGVIEQFTTTPIYPQPPVSATSAGNPQSQPSDPPLQSTSWPAEDDARQQVEHYLEQSAPEVLHRIAANAQLPLDPHHSRLILADLQRQALPRLAYYKETASRDSGHPAADADIASRTIHDIEMAMQLYVERLLQKEEGQ
ncbi:spore germination protein GerPC [Paenibacillus daejeonensis]|uniref:spore germination protein GerPC n=1 Tax=Paenibacillus daejeonensis TaxID=135193 RepID=UPI00037D9393|nr:spore germination protein GerPC [Paenibacillus daejeonensis]